MMAAKGGHREIIKALITAGADTSLEVMLVKLVTLWIFNHNT